MRARGWIGRVARAAAAGGAALAAYVAYRRQELVVVALLAGSLVAGFAVDAWHRRAPALLDRLEAEPPRLEPVRTAPRRPVPRSRAARGEPPRARERPLPPPPPPRAPAESPSPAHPVELDRATLAELMRLPGVGPRLAARILAQREALGGRFRSFEDFASVPGLGARRAALLRPLTRLAPEPDGLPGPAAERENPAIAETPP